MRGGRDSGNTALIQDAPGHHVADAKNVSGWSTILLCLTLFFLILEVSNSEYMQVKYLIGSLHLLVLQVLCCPTRPK